MIIAKPQKDYLILGPHHKPVIRYWPGIVAGLAIALVFYGTVHRDWVLRETAYRLALSNALEECRQHSMTYRSTDLIRDNVREAHYDG